MVKSHTESNTDNNVKVFQSLDPTNEETKKVTRLKLAENHTKVFPSKIQQERKYVKPTQ